MKKKTSASRKPSIWLLEGQSSFRSWWRCLVSGLPLGVEVCLGQNQESESHRYGQLKLFRIASLDCKRSWKFKFFSASLILLGKKRLVSLPFRLDSQFNKNLVFPPFVTKGERLLSVAGMKRAEFRRLG